MICFCPNFQGLSSIQIELIHWKVGNFRPKTQFLGLLAKPFFSRIMLAFRPVKICANSCEIFLILKGGLLSFPPPSFHVSANDVLIKQIAYSTKEAACSSLIQGRRKGGGWGYRAPHTEGEGGRFCSP